VADSIKCLCSHCGAKYRLPAEAAGRSAKCKRCGEKFHIPREQSLEDSVITWLTGPGDDEGNEETIVARPRVINMPKERREGKDGETPQPRGPIRMKTGSGKEESA
jgi:hypothetical protein